MPHLLNPKKPVKIPYTPQEMKDRMQRIRWSISSDGALCIWLDGASHMESFDGTPFMRAVETWVKNHPAFKKILEEAPTPPVGNCWQPPARVYSIG